jgi:hypothetical protein
MHKPVLLTSAVGSWGVQLTSPSDQVTHASYFRGILRALGRYCWADGFTFACHAPQTSHASFVGTVIPPHGSMFVSPDVAAFRARPTSPRGGEGRFVQVLQAGASIMPKMCISLQKVSIMAPLSMPGLHLKGGAIGDVTGTCALTTSAGMPVPAAPEVATDSAAGLP